MTKGRPKLPEGEKMVTISLRLPRHVLDEFKRGGNVSQAIRRVLENYLQDGD